MLLQQEEYEIELDDTNLKKILVNVKYLYKTFKNVLPKSLKTRGFGKYNIPIKLYNLIVLNTYQIEYDEIEKKINIIFENIIFEPDNKVFNGKYIVSLEEYIDYQDYNMDMIIENLGNIDLEIAKKLLILNYNHVGILERKINKLEEEIDSLTRSPYDYNSDY